MIERESVHSELSAWRRKGIQHLRAGMEALVLAMACLSPWAFGAVEPVFESILYYGIGLLVVLWGLRVLLAGSFTWKKCPVAFCLAGLFLTGLWQICPLPRPFLERLSPATAGLYDRLLPVSEEILPFGMAKSAAQPPAGSTLSLYPGATRQEMVRLLAIFLLFTAIRNNVASVAALRRLSIALVVNGALLALFGFIQFFTSPHDTVYWTFPSAGRVFGPFICRNHFPYYLNVCLGLGVGLLLCRKGSNQKGDRTLKARGPVHFLSGLLEDPWALWIAAALALMFAGVLFCLSRGGLLAMLGGLLCCLVIKLVRSPRSFGWGYLFLSVVLGGALVAWFGFGRVEERLLSLWKSDALQGARGALWSRLWPLVKDFPVWGTGYGTFPYIEPLTRSSPTDVGLVYDHAHNDYLEVLVEGGVVALLLAAFAVISVVWLTCRGFYRHADKSAGGLALGGLFGLAAVAVHSFGDFGLHVPAIAIVVAALGANLCALAAPASNTETESEPGTYRFRFGGLAPLMGAAAAVMFALVLCGEGRRTDLAHRYFQAGRPTASAGPETRIVLLEAGARLAPEYAGLQSELGQAHLTMFENRLKELDEQVHVSEVAQAVAAGAPVGGAGLSHALTFAVSNRLAGTGFRHQMASVRESLTQEHLAPALLHFLQARDRCPLLSKPHFATATYRDVLASGDTRSDYLNRAKLLMAPDPELWYRCGLQELEDGQVQQAWQSWRRSLDLSNRYLPLVLVQVSRGNLDAATVIDKILPEKADMLFSAANELFAEAEAAPQRKPYMERALALLEKSAAPLPAEEYHTKGMIYWSLGQEKAAAVALQTALSQKPTQVDWRLDLARLLHQQGLLRDSQREVRLVLIRQPDHQEARQLLKQIEQQ
jgi:O-antigen ligase